MENMFGDQGKLSLKHTGEQVVLFIGKKGIKSKKIKGTCTPLSHWKELGFKAPVRTIVAVLFDQHSRACFQLVSKGCIVNNASSPFVDQYTVLGSLL